MTTKPLVELAKTIRSKNAGVDQITFTIRREKPSGSPGERDVFGAQQYAPLFDLPIPI